MLRILVPFEILGSRGPSGPRGRRQRLIAH